MALAEVQFHSDVSSLFNQYKNEHAGQSLVYSKTAFKAHGTLSDIIFFLGFVIGHIPDSMKTFRKI